MKVAVIGVGAMGANHVRVLKNIPEVTEIAICDIRQDNLDNTNKRFAINKRYTNHHEMLDKEKPDGVIVATHPADHRQSCLDALDSGSHVLVEKPIAPSVEDAQVMIDRAVEKGLLLTVGHVERFNPVVTRIRQFIDEGSLTNIYLVNTHRVGPFPKRLLGNVEGVLIDLAVHDFDIITFLASPMTSIHSQVIKSSNQEIYMRTLMDLESGAKASCEFSWISPRMIRTIEVYGAEGMLLGDYFNQEVWLYENDDYDNISEKNIPFFRDGLIKSGKIIKYPMYKQEPLLLEVTNFVRAIEGSEEILVKPAEAALVLKNALSLT